MENEKGLLLCLMIFIAVALSSVYFVSAQSEDSDADGIVDGMDACPATNPEEGIPISVRDRDYLGCACSQIYEMTGDNYCLDVFCSSSRPLLIQERTYSSRETSCQSDFCVKSTLYDYPDNIQVPCVNGKEALFKCDPKIIQNASECINGSVNQYEPEEVPLSEEKEEIFSIHLNDYEKLQIRAYGISQDNAVKTVLGISGEDLFFRQTKKTMDSLIIEKTLTTETKNLLDTEKTVSTQKIKIIPDKRAVLEDVYLFEELPRGSNIQLKEIIPGEGVVYQEGNPPVIVWKIDRVSESVELSYQVIRHLDGESNTLVIAKEVKDNTWILGFIPLGLIFIFVYVFIYVSKKSVPRRKRIFKE